MTFYIDLLMHTGLFVITIPVFYFEFVTRVVTYALIDNFTTIAQQKIVDSNLNKMVKKQDVQPVIDYVNIQFTPKINNFNQLISERNNKIYTLAYSICGSISALCIGLSFILSLMYEVNFLEILIENLIVLGFILLSEFLLVTIFLNKLEIIDGDFLDATTISSMISPSLWDCPPGWTSRKQCSWGERCDYINKLFPINLVLKIFPSLSDYI
jgi:hypothetical protein